MNLPYDPSLLEAILNTTADAVFVKDLSGKYLYINPAGARFFGKTADEVIGKDDTALFSPEAAQAVMERDREVLLSGEIRKYVDVESAEGARQVFFSTKIPYRDAAGKVVGLFGTARDITEREQERNRFHALLDTIPGFVCLLSRDHAIRFANRYFHERFGDPAGKPCYAAMRGREAPCDDCRDAAVIESGVPMYWTWERSPDEIYDVYDHLFVDDDGSPLLLKLGIDVTERVRAVQLRRELEEMRLRSRRMESVGQLAGGVAHNLNNLLTVINGYGDLLKKEMDQADPRRSMVGEMRLAGERARELVGRLLAFGRRQMLTPEIFDANRFLLEAEPGLRQVVRPGMIFRLSAGAGPGLVRLDPKLFRQAVSRLIAHTVSRMPGRGEVSIRSEEADLGPDSGPGEVPLAPGRYFVLKISGTGKGMDAESLSRIFDPFHESHDPDEGLDLASVYGFVKQSGGFIWAESSGGEGTTFTVCFPRAGLRE